MTVAQRGRSICGWRLRHSFSLSRLSHARFVPTLPAQANSQSVLVAGIACDHRLALITLISGLAGRTRNAGLSGLELFSIVGLLATGGAAIFPVMLYSTLAPENSLTAYNAVASSPSALRLASIWWPLGFALAAIYFVFISRRYAGKVSITRDNQTFY